MLNIGPDYVINFIKILVSKGYAGYCIPDSVAAALAGVFAILLNKICKIMAIFE